jgi:hypothetical protein
VTAFRSDRLGHWAEVLKRAVQIPGRAHGCRRTFSHVLAPAETFANDFLYLIKPCNYNIFDRSSSEHYSLDVQSMNAVRAYLNEVRRDDWHFAD